MGQSNGGSFSHQKSKVFKVEYFEMIFQSCKLDSVLYESHKYRVPSHHEESWLYSRSLKAAE